MSRRGGLVLALLLFFSIFAAADEEALWREYGLESTNHTKQGRLEITTYQMKDLTGALAAWEWLRSPAARTCDLAAFCTREGTRTVVSDYNYVIVFSGPEPTKTQLAAALNGLPNKHETSLPAILTFVPRQGLVPESARYVLGPASLATFAPELVSSKPGFTEGAEAQVAEYRVGNSNKPVHLALFYYPAPEMARLHSAAFRQIPGTRVRRSSVLVAVVYGNPTDQEADTLLSRVQYEAKVTWNDSPPPSPIKPLFQLLWNIIYLSLVLAAICLLAGLMYAGMRIYRRRYGTLESEEAMTTLGLTRDSSMQG
ncbi:MAG: hypothetical protein JO270_15905 [Acidobacteriaceae bacterium]|nr:hypothetical protein [Acidobacteriaceae bacterium]